MRMPARSLAMVCAVLALLALPSSKAGAAASFETTAREAILIDDETGTVLFEHNADVPTPPASLSKLMTVYLVFEALKTGRISLDDSFRVSEQAWRMGGSKMFVELGSAVRVDDLLRGVIVQSGNDACIVLAEGLSGSEQAFVEAMNAKGQELGLSGSHFLNSTGWPEDGHVMSARDIAELSRRLIHDFPEYYPMFAELEFVYNGIKQGNRNPLLYKTLGADGLKTGHTELSGYGLAASAIRGERRLIAVVQGLDGVNARSQETERLLEYGFREFERYALFEAGETVIDAEVWLGASASVPLVIGQGLGVTLARSERSGLKVAVVYDGPVPAPIALGQDIGRLVVSVAQRPILEAPLQAGADVAERSRFERFGTVLGHLLWGRSEKAAPQPTPPAEAAGGAPAN